MVIIRNGHVVDPSTGIDGVMDIVIKNGKIEKVIPQGESSFGIGIDEEIDAQGLYVMPGFIDLHVHLREPGLTYKEDIETGALAAAKGGVTTICAMPNTKPVVDSPEILQYVKDTAKKKAVVHVEQLSAMTKGQDGKEIVDVKAMLEAGAIAFSEDGKSVMDINVFREALEEIGKAGGVVMSHCEDKNLVGRGVLNKGVASEKFNVPGISNSVEDIICARDIFMANEANVKLHLCHCSTKGSVYLMRMAKSMGFDVTAEVCPHHFTLTDADIQEEDTDFKMNPPLRTEEDVKALIEGLRDGTMDVISTDHAPHSKDDKSKGFMEAPFGIVGLETSAAITYTALVATGLLTISQMVEKMSTNPAKVIGIENERGTLREGARADIAIFDPSCEWEVNPDEFLSKGKNTPYKGKVLKGKVVCTIADGHVVYREI